MLYQNADSGDSVLVVIALVAIIVFVLMMITAFAIVRSERKTQTPVPSKDDLESGSPAVESTILPPVDGATIEVKPDGEIKARPFAAFFSGERQKNAGASVESAQVDKSPKVIQTLNLVACFILATGFAWLNFSHVQHIVNATSLSPYFILLAIFSPICIAVAWLRLTGIKWRLGNRNLVRDLIGIVLALALGFGGQRFLSDPVSVLAPELPVLSTQDWPGSQFSVEPQIIEAGAWSETRAFRQSLILIRNEIAIAEVTQTILWHADRMQAAAAWDQHRNDPYYDFPVVVSNTDNNRPEIRAYLQPA